MTKIGWSYYMLRQKTSFSDTAQYICRCESCQEIFFQTTIKKLCEMVLGEDIEKIAKRIKYKDFRKLLPSKVWRRPQQWYIDAGRHWVANKTHMINVVVEDELSGFREIVFSLSSDWKRGLTLEPDQSDQAMLNELDHLEAKLK